MRRLQLDTRIGVPQGPAYARIIAEIFLGMILDSIGEKLEGKQAENLILYRYMDDIIIFHDQSFDSQKLFQTLNNPLLENGLILNKEKSHIYGKIGDLTKQQTDEITRVNQFQYGLKKNDYSYLLEQDYVYRKLKEVIGNKGGFKVFDISYYFSEYTNETAKLYCFNQYAEKLVKNS